MASNDINVKLWGVRGSYPVPGQSTIRYGGNTSCIEVRARDHIIILDAGTGIVGCGDNIIRTAAENGDGRVVNLVFTHTHYDHIQGLPFFAPAYSNEFTLNIFGPKCFEQSIRQIVTSTLQPQYSPVEIDDLKSRMVFQDLHEDHVLVFRRKSTTPELADARNVSFDRSKDVVLRAMRSYAHPKIGTFVFRIEAGDKSIVYATDTEGYVGGDARLTDFTRDANLLIHDAQYDPEEYKAHPSPRQGYGHSTYEMAAEIAHAAKVKQLVLFHHDPMHDDDKIAEMERQTQELFPNAEAGTEGREFSL